MAQPTAQPPEIPSRQAAGPVPTSDLTLQPPHDADAEQAVLGACMHGPAVIDEIRPMLVAADFYRPHHETIWRALLALRGEDKPTDPIAVSHYLTCRGDINRVGGVAYIHQLYCAPPSVSGTAYYAGIVSRTAALRRLREHSIRAVQRTQEPGADPDEIRSAIEADLGTERERALASGTGRLSRHIADGWRFVTEAGADKEPLWGTREKTAWASGESLMIVGAPGVGKTTLAHQVILARIGLQDTVLDMPVAPSKRVLYLAMDRPQQIARAMFRRIQPEHETILRERLVVWQGPLPATLDKEPDLLADLAAAHGADTIVIDSLKDAVSTLVDDALAVAFQNARMRALRNGVEVMELHHQRKALADAPKDQRPALDRVYGSTWITSGAGSVLFLTGEAGDPAVTLHHLKMPTGEIGPLQLIHDHARGTTTVDPALDPVTILRASPNGLSVRDLAKALTRQAAPDRAAVEKARRSLDQLVEAGLATKTQGTAGGSGGGQQALYRASARHIAAIG